MTNHDAIKKAAIKDNFGPTALGILFQAQFGPVNPWDHFGNSIRRSWGYAYFSRLIGRGWLVPCDAPKGRRGQWYALGEEA